MELTHANLCNVAVSWLKRPNSAGGHGCQVAVSEVRSGWSGEVPDPIGFRAAGGQDDGSVVVEVKVSRADFLADAKKAHRNGETPGLGNWRYYMCPEGVINASDIPQGFGLLHVNNRGHVKHVVSPFTGVINYKSTRDWMSENKFKADQEREQFILVKLLARVGDAEQLNRTLKAAYAEARSHHQEAQRVRKLHQQQRLELRRLKNEISKQSKQ